MFYDIRATHNRTRQLLSFVLFTGLVALTPLAAAAGAKPTVLLGAHVGRVGAPDAEQQFSALETAVGRKLAIDNDEEPWFENAPPAGFPNVKRIQWDIQNGRIPMLSWLVASEAPRKHARSCATAEDIMAGKYDDQIARQARTVRDFHTTILIRWNMELSSISAGCFYGGRDLADSNGPELGRLYVGAWRHIVDIFRKQGANNVQWVWAPGSRHYASLDGAPSDRWKTSFPGADYVDWIAIDHYNKEGEPLSLADDRQFKAFYDQTAPLGKPLMIAETGANSDSAQHPDPQTVWLSTIRTTVPQRYPALKAILYWDVPTSHYKRGHPGFEGSYTLTGSGLAAFKALANDPYFQAKDPSPYNHH